MPRNAKWAVRSPPHPVTESPIYRVAPCFVPNVGLPMIWQEGRADVARTANTSGVRIRRRPRRSPGFCYFNPARQLMITVKGCGAASSAGASTRKR